MEKGEFLNPENNQDHEKKERIAKLRKQIEMAEESEDERRVLLLEAELRFVEQGEAFNREAALENIQKTLPTERTQEPRTYEYYEPKSIREDIYLYAKELADYIESENIRNVVFLDRAARKAWIALDEYWNLKYPDKQKPGFYFMNPDVFKTYSFAQGAQYPLRAYKTDLMDTQVIRQLEENYPALLAEKDKPVIIFDTCAHTGYTIQATERMFNLIGFRDVRVVTASPPSSESGVRSAISFEDKKHVQMCTPFAMERSVETDRNEVVSRRGEKRDVSLGTKLRKELRRVVRDQFKPEL